MSHEIITHQPEGAALTDGASAYRTSTNAATLCRDIVHKTAKPIQGRKYVSVEGWQAIAIAHGCTASARAVEKIEGGIRAIGEVRNMNDGRLIAQAEGFLGDDEKTWASRPLFARRAMAQTRAISRACRSAFAHVVVLIDADLGTTPAEEMEAAVVESPRKVASVTGEVLKKKPEWTKEQKDEAASIRSEIHRAGGEAGEMEVADLWKRMQYDTPTDVIDALAACRSKWQEIEHQATTGG